MSALYCVGNRYTCNTYFDFARSIHDTHIPIDVLCGAIAFKHCICTQLPLLLIGVDLWLCMSLYWNLRRTYQTKFLLNTMVYIVSTLLAYNALIVIQCSIKERLLSSIVLRGRKILQVYNTKYCFISKCCIC